METPTQVTSLILPILSIIGLTGTFVLAVVYINAVKKRGAYDGAKEVIALKNEQIKALEDQNKLFEDKLQKQKIEFEEKMAKTQSFFHEQHKENQTRINELTGKIGELTGMLQVKENQNESLKSILEGRSPEMMAFFSKAVPIIDKSAEYYSVTLPIIKSTETHMEKELVLFEGMEKLMQALLDKLNEPNVEIIKKVT